MHDKPDVEVEFFFEGVRKHPSSNGYRPLHKVTDDLLTMGIHHYYGSDIAPLLGRIRGTITFLSPTEYPYSMEVGKEVAIQEGAKVVGYAKILRILNPLLIAK